MADTVSAARGIQQRYEGLSPVLNEQALRWFAATEAQSYGHGGVSLVSRITGIARSTICRGMKEIAEKRPLEAGRIRKRGAGRKAKLAEDSTLLSDLEQLVETGNPRGSDGIDPLDVEKSATLIAGVGWSGPCSVSARNCRLSARTWVQSPGKQ